MNFIITETMIDEVLNFYQINNSVYEENTSLQIKIKDMLLNNKKLLD